MARFFVFLTFISALIYGGVSVLAQSDLPVNSNIEDDVYVSGSDVKQSTRSPRDLFVSGFSVVVDGEVGEDAHIAGFDVEVEGDVHGDLYAVGARVSVEAPVGNDLTVSGFKVSLDRHASIGGNARIGAGKIEIDAPLSGNLVAAGENVSLNAVVAGDARITASEIIFGDNARISGELVYSAPEEIEIPSSVIDASRVKYEPFSRTEMLGDMARSGDYTKSIIWASIWGGLAAYITLLVFLLVVAVACLASKPELVENLREHINQKPGKSLIVGFIGMASLFGLVPASAVLIVGIPLIPIVGLLVCLIWLFGYLLGTYAVFWRISGVLGRSSNTTVMKLIVIGIGSIVFTFVIFIPVLGWLIILLTVLLGFGAIGEALIMKYIAKPRE